jgi:hypothetical protein
MALYKVRAPDGEILKLEGPEGASNEELFKQAQLLYTPKEIRKNTSGFSDVATAAKQGLVGTAKSLTDVFGAENEYSQKLAGVQQRLEQEYTPERALERQKREQLQEEAAKSGDLTNEITTFLGGVTEAPVQALASGLASIVPYVGTGIIGGVFKLGAPTVAALNSVLGASQGAGSIKGSVYSSVKKELEKGGMNPKEAEDRAIKAQEYLGDNWKNIIAGAGIGAVAGRKGVEELLVPGALARQQANIIPRVATTVLKEAPIEGLQGGQQQFAENIALQQEGFDVPTFQGVAGSAARDAATGAIVAAPLGAIARPPKVDLEATYTNVINELRNKLGTSETLEPQEVLKQIQQISQLQDPAQIQALYETALNNGDFNTVPMPNNSIRIQIPEAGIQQKAKEAIEDSTPDAFTPELRQNVESFKQPIIKQMQKFGLSNVGLKIFDTIENGRADGYYANKIIALAMDSPSPIGTLRHETVHALRELGGFKPNEWNVLSKKAKNEWTDQFIKNVKVGDGTLYDQYQAQYQKDNNGSLDGFDDYITEEAVAEAFRYFDVNGAPSGLVGNLYYRLKQFFETLRNGFTGAGFDTTDKIFTRVEQGKAAQNMEGMASQPNKYALTNRIDMNYKDVTQRIPELQEAAQKLQDNEITAKQYDKLVNKYKPVTPYDFVPEPATSKEAIDALKDDGSKELYGAPSKVLKKGHPVGLRLDIPAYTSKGVWVPTVHEQASGFGAGKKIGHESVAAVTNPTFGMSEKAALSIAGGKPKGTIATIKGNWKPTSKEEAVVQAEQYLTDPSWIQVGMDPERHSYFYNRETMQPVVSADEALQIGPLVFAKNPVYSNKSNFKYSIKNVPPLQEAFDYARSKDFKTNRDLKVDLQSQILKELDRKNIDIKEFDKKTIEYLTEIGELDAEYALKSNPNAVGWYDITVAKALNIVGLLHPEILTNPDAKFAFTWALAVTSNGIKVDKNFELAEQAYRGYKENGVMPTNIQAGQAQKAINIGLGMFNQMVDKYGIDDMRKFMATEFTVSQLKKITNLDLAGENADTKVLGAFILGAKIGNGFFSNLNGIFDKLTMDRWLMRTWGRWTGTLITERPDKVKEYIGINRRNIAGLKTNPELREAVEAITKTNITVDSLEEILKDNESVQNFALKLAKYWSKEDLRNIIDSAPKGEAFRLSTNTLSKYVDGQKEKPDSGTERNEIREIFSNILERLNKKGYKDLSMADLQAALWYSERRLYDSAKESNVLENYADDEAPDYANAAAGLVIQNGISQEAVDEVILDTEEQYADRATGVQRDAGEVSTKVSPQGRVQGFVGKELKHFLARGVLQSYRELNEETPDTFKRNSGEDGKGFRVLKHHAKTRFSPELKFANSLKTIGVTTPTFYEMDAEAAPTFQKLIQESKDDNDFGAAVTVYPVEAYEDMRLFLTKDGKAGFALKGNDIVSVFSQAPYVGGVNGIIRLAVQEGGRKLDAFDTVLPDLYFNNGFQVTSRMKWNDDYVPDGWNKETFKDFNNGEPDVVFMAYEPSNNKRPTNQTGKLVDDYDEAVNIQEEVVKVAPRYSLSKRQGSIDEQNKRFAFALQNKLTPDTFLTSDRNKDINGNLAFMPQNSPFPKLPIRMAVGIQDDVQNRGSGATHILRRIQQEYDKAHMPEPLTKDLLEDLLRRAENVGESFGFVYRSGNNLVLHDGLSKVSMFVNKQPDHFSINSMYKDPEAFRKYGNPVWRGRNEQPMRNFQKKVTEDFRAVPVVAGERGVELKNKPTAPTIGVKKRRVVSPDEIAKLAPAGAKLAIRAPETPAFKRWFGGSKIVNEDGTPKLMYHGTAKDITEFRPKQANAIFLTSNPKFAETFSDSSESYSAEENISGVGNMPHKQLEALRKEARRISNKEDTDFEDEFKNLVIKNLPTRGNIMPVFVRAENPFDYENTKHIDAITQKVEEMREQDWRAHTVLADEVPDWRNDIKVGRWRAIENPQFQKAIKALGFDSFYVKEGGYKNLGVYNPSQVKSAIGNVGTFDIGTPDIRYSLNRLTTLQTNKTAGQKISQAYDTARSNFGNSDYWIAKRNGWIDPSSGLAKSLQKLPVFNLDGELRADMLVRAKSQALNLIKNGLLSGIPVLNPDGTIGIQRSENNFARSMYLADQLNNNATVKASGLSGRGYVAEVARILRGADILKEDARLNAEGVRQLAEARIAMKEAKDLFKQGKMKEARKKEKEAKKLQKEGIQNRKSKRELQVTPAHIKWAEQQLTKVPEMNEILGIWKTVNNGLVDLWEEVGLLSKSKADEYRGKDNYIPLFKSQEDLGDAEFFAFPGGGLKSTKGFKQLKGSTAIRNIWENLDKHYAVMLSHAYENQTRRVAVNQLKTFQLAENLNANDPEVNLWYKEDGKKVGARIENLNDLAAFQMMTYELGPIMQFFAGSTQLLRAGALINPMYWIKQLIRDPIHANLVAGSGMITPLHSMRGFVEVLMKNSRESKILTDRGVLGSVDSTTTINQFLEQFGKEKASPSILSKALNKVMSIHEASDAATRVEIYKKAEAKALKEGKTAEQAIDYAVHMARESINFSVHGNSPTLNALRHSIPFFSAAINSLDTVYRAATGFGLNAKEKKEAQLMFFQRAVMMTVLSTMYAMLYQDDEEYKKLPDYVKDNHWLIPNPMSEKPPFIKIPTPFEIGFFFKTIPEGLVRYFSDTSTGKEVLASYKAGLIHNLPANGLPIPQAIKPVLENIVNYSFFTGRGIEGMSDQGLPIAQRGQRASEFAKTLSSYGLDKLGQSPAKIDNLIQGYFAELGTFSAGLASSLLFMAEGKEPPAKNIENMPFMKAFLTDRNVVKAISDFYDLDHNAKEVATYFNDLKQTGMTEDIQKLIDDPEKKAQLMASPVFRKVSTQMATIRKAINYYKVNQDSGSPDFRRDKINELTEILGRVAESGYKIAEATGVSR